MKHDPQSLKPAERSEPEPEAARQGWKGKEVSEDELVDDQFIEQDESSVVADDEEKVQSLLAKRRPDSTGGPNVPDVR
jgi:hypothetical protein